MTAYPAWTPASRPGIIPLHPLTFGTILGRSFAALRQNPRVLLGFALCVQSLAYVVMIVALGGIAWASFSRLGTLQPGTDDYQAILAGSIAITAVAGIVLGIAAMALSVIVQGVVVAEVAHAAVAEKLTLRALWQQIKPVAWRLIGYSLLLIAVMIVGFAVVGVAIFGLGVSAPPAAVAVAVLAFLAAIPLVLWISVKLVAVPSAIILERARIGDAIARSWRLTRGRFWSTLGILVLLNLIFSGIAQVVSLPFSFVSAGLTTVIAPTGDPNVSSLIALVISALLTQAVVLLIQAVASVVQATAAALIYIDCRMRHEGLDLDLLAYVERRDAGITPLPDPYLEHIGREIAPRGAYPQPYPAPGYPYGQARAYAGAYPGGPGAYAQGSPYGQAPAHVQNPGYGQAPAHGQAPAYAAGPAYGQNEPSYDQPTQTPAYAEAAPAYPAAPAHPSASPTPEAAPPAEEPAAPKGWTAPGQPADGTDRESPWA
ncbi:glycerophosphoryl diester phosphodiesterase membrane domain-containing protein [Microbacterium sp. NPDC019599]|uniref:glycerophosphoryl diester phosphodiesterase membrane domain-containing protein n=1 Tax=Microbacterium sp. NPDC019599 TaxID=3154690 RepID=UPI0034105DC0